MNPIAVARHMLQNSAMKIPQVKSCVKRWHSLGMGRSEAKILPVMEKLIGMLGRAGGDLTGQTLLELGPGQTPDLMIGALMLRAARVIGLDISRDMPKHARESCAHIDLRRWLKAAMREGRLGCHSTVNESHVSTAGRISEAKFSLPLYDGKRFPLPDDSVDIVWSNCVLDFSNRDCERR
ncbi:MAG: class I SAM-dependent methyltransferase, partial [Planctomycetota bacterium]